MIKLEIKNCDLNFRPQMFVAKKPWGLEFRDPVVSDHQRMSVLG